MENIFEALRVDHDKQRNILEELVKTSGDTKKRADLFSELKLELEKHAKFEERLFYKPLMSSDLTQDKSRHSIAEHKDIDDKIEDLESSEFSSTGWLTKLKTLKDLVEHHLEEEEHEVFQLAGKILTDKEKSTLASQYNQKMNIARS